MDFVFTMQTAILLSIILGGVALSATLAVADCIWPPEAYLLVLMVFVPIFAVGGICSLATASPIAVLLLPSLAAVAATFAVTALVAPSAA